MSAEGSQSPAPGGSAPSLAKILQKIDEIALSVKTLSSQTKRIGRYQSLSLRWDNQHQRNIRAAVDTINTIVNVLRQKTGVSDLRAITIEDDPSLMSESMEASDFDQVQPVIRKQIPPNISLHDLLIQFGSDATYSQDVVHRMKYDSLREISLILFKPDDFQTLDAISAEQALHFAFRWASDDFPDKQLRTNGLIWIKAVATKFPLVVSKRAFHPALLNTMRFVEKEYSKFPSNHEYAIFLKEWEAHMNGFLGS